MGHLPPDETLDQEWKHKHHENVTADSHAAIYQEFNDKHNVLGEKW